MKTFAKIWLGLIATVIVSGWFVAFWTASKEAKLMCLYFIGFMAFIGITQYMVNVLTEK